MNQTSIFFSQTEIQTERQKQPIGGSTNIWINKRANIQTDKLINIHTRSWTNAFEMQGQWHFPSPFCQSVSNVCHESEKEIRKGKKQRCLLQGFGSGSSGSTASTFVGKMATNEITAIRRKRKRH